ncbi:MAG: hypothetical protein U0795_15540 [Pirellulales bacterium]
MNRLLAIVVAFTATLAGCTHIQLQNSSIRQAGTLSDLYEQQVLDNLARAVVDPYATPSFSVANQSTSGVSDRGDFAIANGGFRGRFWDFVGAGASRGVDLNFTLSPVTNSMRLKLMQCAYQQAVGAPSDDCQKCCELMVAWTGNASACNDRCGISSGWVCHSPHWRDVPKCCRDKYGKYCGTYVWADPNRRAEFSKLVMTILDYATGSPHEPKKKQVTQYLDNYGNLVQSGQHSQTVVTFVDEGTTSCYDDEVRRKCAEIQAIESQLNRLNAAKGPAEIARQAQELRMAIPSFQGIGPPNVKDLSNDDANQLRRQILGELSRKLDDSRNQLRDLDSARELRLRDVDFGPPTQFNSMYNGGILQLQQQLNTVPFRSGR